MTGRFYAAVFTIVGRGKYLVQVSSQSNLIFSPTLDELPSKVTCSRQHKYERNKQTLESILIGELIR